MKTHPRSAAVQQVHDAPNAPNQRLILALSASGELLMLTILQKASRPRTQTGQIHTFTTPWSDFAPRLLFFASRSRGRPGSSFSPCLSKATPK